MKKIVFLSVCLTIAVATLCHAETLPKTGFKGLQTRPEQAVPQQTGQPARNLAVQPNPRIVRVTSPREWLKEGGISIGLTGINDVMFQEYSAGDRGVHNITLTSRDGYPGEHYCDFVARPGSNWVLGNQQPDGVRSLSQAGYLKPFRDAVGERNFAQSLLSNGCSLTVQINFKHPNGKTVRVNEVVRLEVRPHQEVKIRDTSRLRNWLRPFHSPACISDDSGGQLGVKITTGPLGATCRTDFMTTRNRNRVTDWNSNKLPEGVYLPS